MVANTKGRTLIAELRPKQVIRALELITLLGAHNVGLRLEGYRAPGNVMRDSVLRALANPASVPNSRRRPGGQRQTRRRNRPGRLTRSPGSRWLISSCRFMTTKRNER
jgi:hypothetical protein